AAPRVSRRPAARPRGRSAAGARPAARAPLLESMRATGVRGRYGAGQPQYSPPGHRTPALPPGGAPPGRPAPNGTVRLPGAAYGAVAAPLRIGTRGARMLAADPGGRPRPAREPRSPEAPTMEARRPP